MPIDYRTDAPVSAAALAALFVSSGINRPTDDLPRLRKMLDNATLTLTAWSGDTLVGIARSVTDFVYCCYLSDLAVDRAFQRQGIGRTLVEKTREAVGPQCTLLLIAAPEANTYYPKLGFQPLERGWIIRRTK